MIVSDNDYIKLVSRPYHQRIALIPVSIALVLGWLIVIAALVLLFTLQAMPFYFLFIAMLGGTYLAFVTISYIKDSKQQYELQINGKQITLLAFDKDRNTRTRQQISLGELISAEYFTPRDTSSLFLHGKNNDVEIPLWTFGPQQEYIVIDYLKAHGVKTIDVPSTVQI